MGHAAEWDVIMRLSSGAQILWSLLLTSPVIDTILSATAFAQKKKVPIVIAFLGDSLTEGLGVSPTSAYPALVEHELQRKGHSVRVINAGISGSTSASGPSRMKWILKSKPTWVVLALGANDGLRGLNTDEMKKNLTQTIDLALASGAKVLLAGMRVPPNFGNEYASRFERAFQEVARSRKQVVFLPFLLESVGGERDQNQPDGIHPNEKGHQTIAKRVIKALEPSL